MRRARPLTGLCDKGCWIWTGAQNGQGYGVMQLDGSARRVHRLSYEWFVGPIAEGLVLDHLCRVRSCANPDHLEPVTTQENSARGQAARTECSNGHTYTDDNTTWRLIRVCKTCRASTRRKTSVPRLK